MGEEPAITRGASLRRALAELPPERRRAIHAAVRAGLAVQQPQDRQLGISVARRSQRRAQSTVLLLPLPALLVWAIEVLPTSAVLVGAIVVAYGATVVLARAVRSERANRGSIGRPGPAVGTDGSSRRRRDHLPRRGG